MITILTRKDLIRESEDLPIEEIGVHHVKDSLIPIQKSDLVLFVDDDRKILVLKYKYTSGTRNIFHSAAMELLITRHLNDNG